MRIGGTLSPISRTAPLTSVPQAAEMEPGSSEVKAALREAKTELKKSKRKNYYKILGVEKARPSPRRGHWGRAAG